MPMLTLSQVSSFNAQFQLSVIITHSIPTHFIFSMQDGGSRFFNNFAKFLNNYTVLQPKNEYILRILDFLAVMLQH